MRKTLEICVMTKTCFVCVKVKRTSNRIWSTSLAISCTYKIIEFKIRIILTINDIGLAIGNLLHKQYSIIIVKVFESYVSIKKSLLT